MGDYIKAVLDALKSPRLVLPVALTAWFLVAARPSLIAKLGLTLFRSTYYSAITLTAIVSTAVLLGQVLGMFYDQTATGISQRRHAKEEVQKQMQLLRGLTDEEKRYLQLYFTARKDCLLFPETDGVVGGLTRQEIMFRSTGLVRGHRFPGVIGYNIVPWARRVLENNQDILNVSPFPPDLVPYDKEASGVSS
jgi:uncharacterized membrane protein